MLNEDLQQNVGLGQNAYAKTQEVQNPPSVDEEGYFGKPEFYDYSAVKLPENYCYDKALLDEFNELAGKYNLSQKSANELMAMAVKLTELTSKNYSATIAEQQRLKIDELKRALINDRDLGGVNFAKTLRTADIAYTQFADNEVQSVLNDTGLNCHPAIVRMFYNIGKRMQNDRVYQVNGAAAPKENREDILFPTMQ